MAGGGQHIRGEPARREFDKRVLQEGGVQVSVRRSEAADSIAEPGEAADQVPAQHRHRCGDVAGQRVLMGEGRLGPG